jgi:hypothetical protein
MSPGELLTRWTVRLALVLYVAGLTVFLTSRGRPRWDRGARRLWTFGCGLYLLHVWAAFQFFHDWSHQAAWRDTARQTAELTGWNWGGGVWINYAFTVAWTVDVLTWWLRGTRVYRQRSMWISLPLQCFLAFVAFNATVVFETGATRWAGVVASLMLLGLAAREWWD